MKFSKKTSIKSYIPSVVIYPRLFNAEKIVVAVVFG